jgi:threonine dehydrogenase-like Zn-dependent dehydrogenase
MAKWKIHKHGATDEMKEQVSIAIVGAGSRGYGYGRLANALGGACKIAAVAEPREFFRKRAAEEFE